MIDYPSFLFQVRIDKPFAYYISTEKCLPPYIVEFIALGNSKRCDVFVNSYQERCSNKNIPKHIFYFFHSKTTWTSSRNFLYAKVKQMERQYFYHIFMDDDVVPIYTDHVVSFGKTFSHREGDVTLFQDYIQSERGLKEAIYLEKDGKSAWRAFEDDLLINSPAFAVTNYIRLPDGFESRLRMHKHWEEVCQQGKEMPPVLPTLYFDELFIAFHREALPILLPYTTIFDDISWHLSGKARLSTMLSLSRFFFFIPRHFIGPIVCTWLLPFPASFLLALIISFRLNHSSTAYSNTKTYLSHNRHCVIGCFYLILSDAAV